MLRNKIYYQIKPFVPLALRTAIRRRFALRLRARVRDTWPIMPGSEQAPEGWLGWPEDKQFALVLTHDVEGEIGLGNCKQLMRLEAELGFRSSFNFIPEGSYRVNSGLREELAEQGFEVGVHDLNHDGKLYQTYREFLQKGTRINHYLKDWQAAGFRSAFMLHNLEWLHGLNIKYDASTFDTDPFEPQPEGRHTIFPFWVYPTLRNGSRSPEQNSGYVELPYTLPQDSTLFLLLQETTSDIWIRKLDWIAEHGGMALVNIHPDYVDFAGNGSSSQRYPVARVRELLLHVSERFAGKFWNPSPRELADWYTESHGHRNGGSPGPTTISSSNGEGRLSPAAKRLQGKRAAVLLYSYYPSDPRPRRAAEALVEAGVDVDMLCLRESDAEPAEELINGVHVTRVRVRKTRQSKLTYLIQYGRFLAASFAFLTGRGRRKRYDLIHVHNMPDALVFAAVVPKMRGARIILDLHDPMPELFMSIYGLSSNHWLVAVLRKVEQWSIAFADVAFTPNIAFQRLFIARSCSPQKMQIVMNSPQENIFNLDSLPMSRIDVVERRHFHIMHHGSIVPRHGIDLLVKAVAQLYPTLSGLRLDIFGSRTPFLDTVLELARRLGVGEIVRYHGGKSQTEIALAIQESQLGVVPNRRSAFTEINFPTRIFEYLAMHRPVIAPSTQGICDYFDPSELLMFEPDNVEDLAGRILWVQEHPAEARDFVERGLAVYQRNVWQQEKGRLLQHVASLAITETVT